MCMYKQVSKRVAHVCVPLPVVWLQCTCVFFVPSSEEVLYDRWGLTEGVNCLGEEVGDEEARLWDGGGCVPSLCICVLVAEQFITGRLMESGSLEGSSPASCP